jgi:predicted Zn-dependent protease
MISSYFIPFSGFFVGNAVKGAGLSYSRDDERDADQFGMKLALSAGFSPCGSYRFSSKMNQLGQSSSLSFLSTHPGNDERKKNSEEFNQLLKNESCEKGAK